MAEQTYLGPSSPAQTARKSEIVDAFQHAWDGYSKYCLGFDTLHPVSNTCENDISGWGSTAIDSLSTAIILGKEEIVLQILRFIATLDFNAVEGGARMQVFEITIRHFGGMISAWDLLNGPFSDMAKDSNLRQALYDQMVTLGEALSCAFETPSGVPHNWEDPALCKTDSGTRTSVAGAGTLVLEFARLSDISGNEKYANLARRAEGYLLEPKPAFAEPFPGLLGSHVSLDSGELLDSKGSWGAFADCETRMLSFRNKSKLIVDSLLRVPYQGVPIR